ncbi:hypothetical protein TNCV_3955001 [Trichonephila clavipes]|nr:hypothetical protein TNCV_3955001 [Trichonephila clavipes]
MVPPPPPRGTISVRWGRMSKFSGRKCSPRWCVGVVREREGSSLGVVLVTDQGSKHEVRRQSPRVAEQWDVNIPLAYSFKGSFDRHSGCFWNNED